jgi:hypothetical protein
VSRDEPSRELSRPEHTRPSLLAGAGHLAALWALAIVQPLLDLLGRNPDFFVARDNTAGDIIVFALVFSLVPPLVMLALEAIVRRIDERAGWVLHLGLLALLVAALALQVVEHLFSRPAGLILVLALAAGAAGAWLYARGGFVRSLLDVLIPAPLVVLAVFLLFSESSRLVLPGEEAKAAAVEIPSKPPLVFVIFDELPEGTLMTPAGRIDASRFPSFAELARDSTWYREATAAADSTPTAVPALLTGRNPDPGDLPVSAEQPESIFTLLGGAYKMDVTEEVTRLCPEDLCPREGGESAGERLEALFSDLRVVSGHLLLPDALREGLPDVDQTFGGFANEVADSPARFAINDQLQLVAALHAGLTDEALFARFLRGIDGKWGTFDFLHLEVPHYPWVHFPDGRRYTDLSSEFKPFFDDAGRFQAPLPVTDAALQRHLLETGYADTLLGILIERLKRIGAWKRSMVVVVSDHGAGFIPGEFRRSATQGNIGQMAPIPLFVKPAGSLRGRISDRHVCLTSLLSLLATELGIAYPWERQRCDPDLVRQGRLENLVLDEGFTEAPLKVVDRLRDAYIRRIDRLFGAGAGWGRVYGLGPARSFVGRSATGVRLVGGGSAEIEDPGRFSSGPTPETLLRGSLSGVAPGAPLAVAVNGRFVATDQAFKAEGEPSFSILFPPAALRQGPNVVELYAVRGGERPAVALLGSA